MPTEVQIISKPIGTAQERTDWIAEYKTAVDDNGWSFLFGAGVGANLVAVLTKAGEENGGGGTNGGGVSQAMRRTKPTRKPAKRK